MACDATPTVFHAASGLNFAQAEQAVAEAIARVRDAGGGELLVLAPALDFPPPDLAARHRMVRAWADAGAGRVTLALVVPPGLIDPEKFGVVAARNFGLRGNVFSDEADAREWLRLHR